MIYLDNAATSFPKPEACFRRGLEDYLALGASPGRGGYDAAARSQARVREVRERVADFFGASGCVTCFGHNATDALNTLVLGLARPGSHVVSTRLEHNSVLRPLHHLRQTGACELDLVPFGPDGLVGSEMVAQALRPHTCLVVMTHASNVLGTVQPVEAVGRLCRERGIPLVLDISQSAGVVPIRMRDWGASALAFTGHKGLLGPTGVGGLVMEPGLEVLPSRFGGTGLDSLSLTHNLDLPERLEAGTLNLLGILTLGHCLDYLQGPLALELAQKEMELHGRLLEGLAALPGVTVDCPGSGPGRLPLVSCNLEGWDPSEAGMVLDGDYSIAVRAGLHCAPLAHQDLGHGAKGSLRVSLGRYNTQAHVDAFLRAAGAMLRGQ
ncbi:MAG: aminotransferase class V-fold PLP-dependent enzyme [Desulfarculus sp.]|nr:aminotransferase class V-fold PLP-dependent enzyme [Desulfarculus sp.]